MVEDTLFEKSQRYKILTILKEYKIKYKKLNFPSRTSLRQINRWVKLNADILGVSAVRVSILSSEKFGKKCGNALASYIFDISEENSECIYLKKSDLKNSVSCFNNLAHEMRHHYQKNRFKEFLVSDNEFEMEVDAIAYAKLMNYYFGRVCVDASAIMESDKVFKNKSIEEIKKQIICRSTIIREDIQLRILLIFFM